MGIRENLAKKQWLPVGILIVCAVVVGTVLVARSRPEKVPNSTLAYFSDDDGTTWFVASSTKFPPFEHNGKVAVSAHIFTYANGTKQFCGFLSKYTDEQKRRLDESSAKAIANGDPLGTPALFNDPGFMQTSGLVKLPGAGNPWIPVTDPRSVAVYNTRSPDGSAIDQAVIY